MRAECRFGLLPMVSPVRIAIIGAPVACGTEVKDTWRELSQWISRQLQTRHGNSVRVEYHDLFDPACPLIPPGAELPLVIAGGEVLSSGGKLSLPLIRHAVEAIEDRPAGRLHDGRRRAEAHDGPPAVDDLA